MVQLIQTSDIKSLFVDPKGLATNESLKECLRAIQEILLDVYYHLRLWKESRSHRVLAWVRPWITTQQLRDDRQALMDHYIILMGATKFVDHLNGFDIITSTPPLDFITIPPASTTPSESLPFTIEPKVQPENREVTKFWYHCIGSKTTLASSEYFCVDFSSYLAIEVSPVVCKRLLLRLDEKNTGYISFSTLQGLVKQGKMVDIISAYSQDPALPLLIWIDDDVVGNGPKVLEAAKHDVTVIQLASTSGAKAWITINLDYLKGHDNAAEIRFISDQVRVETDSNDVVFENHNAGTEMMKFIRDQGLKAPILIYTDRKSILLTHYVEDDRMAGSLTSHCKVFKVYDPVLGTGRDDDKRWIKYNT